MNNAPSGPCQVVVQLTRELFYTKLDLICASGLIYRVLYHHAHTHSVHTCKVIRVKKKATVNQWKPKVDTLHFTTFLCASLLSAYQKTTHNKNFE